MSVNNYRTVNSKVVMHDGNCLNLSLFNSMPFSPIFFDDYNLTVAGLQIGIKTKNNNTANLVIFPLAYGPKAISSTLILNGQSLIFNRTGLFHNLSTSREQFLNTFQQDRYESNILHKK